MNATATPHTRHPFAPQPAAPEHLDALVRALAGGTHDDHDLRWRAGLAYGEYTAALRDARAAGWVAPWRKSKWYAGIWQLTDAGRARLAELEDAMRDVVVPDNEQVDERAAFLAAARAGRAAALREERAAIVEDYELGFEWRLSEDNTIADESAWLRLIVARQQDAQTHVTVLNAQLLNARREIAALRTERDTLRAKLDAAAARVSELEATPGSAKPAASVIDDGPVALGDRKAQQRPAPTFAPPTRTPPAA